MGVNPGGHREGWQREDKKGLFVGQFPKIREIREFNVKPASTFPCIFIKSVTFIHYTLNKEMDKTFKGIIVPLHLLNLRLFPPLPPLFLSSKLFLNLSCFPCVSYSRLLNNYQQWLLKVFHCFGYSHIQVTQFHSCHGQVDIRSTITKVAKILEDS